jgi:hypothetical protein
MAFEVTQTHDFVTVTKMGLGEHEASECAGEVDVVGDLDCDGLLGGCGEERSSNYSNSLNFQSKPHWASPHPPRQEATSPIQSISLRCN